MRTWGRTALAAVTVIGLAVPASSAYVEDAAVATPSTDGPVRYPGKPNLLLPLPDGRKIAVGTPDLKRVTIQRYSPTTKTWSKPSLLFRKAGLECGAISGTASAGGVALLLECDAGWSEDQAPVRSQALASRDTFTWARTELRGEAYTAPGISPDGRHAVWLAGSIGKFTRWRLGHGFSRASVPYDDDNGGVTAVIDDRGQVSVAGTDGDSESGCRLGIYTKTPAGVRTQLLDLAPGHEIGCMELRVVGRDVNTVVASFGSNDPLRRWQVTRPDPDSAFEVTRIAPYVAPGLVVYSHRLGRAMYTRFSTAQGLPLYAVGSPDRRRLTAQRFDMAAQRWRDPVTIYDHGFGGCTWGDNAIWAPYDLDHLGWATHAVDITCHPKRSASGRYPYGNSESKPVNGHRVLLNAGEGWRQFFVGSRRLGVARNGSWLAVPTSGKVVAAAGSGMVRLPVRAGKRCDIVHPIGPRTVLRLTSAGGNRGWPTLLQRSTVSGWKTIQRLKVTAPDACEYVSHLDWADRPVYDLHGAGETSYQARFSRRNGRWTVQVGVPR